MHSKAPAHDFSTIVQWADISTCIYLPILLATLHYTNSYLKLGSYDSIAIPAALATVELLKYAIYRKYSTKVRKVSTKDLLKTIPVLVIVFAMTYTVAVLFGAPVLSHFEETSMFALIITTLTALPSCLHLGPIGTVNMLLSLTSYQGDEMSNQQFMTKVRATLFGAWLGAICIPLDWNRPWQVWPVPCCMGALLGYVVGCAVSALQLKFKGRKKNKYGLL